MFINIKELSTLSPMRSTFLSIRSTLWRLCTGPKQHGRLCWLSTKSTALISTLLLVCAGLYTLTRNEHYNSAVGCREEGHKDWFCPSVHPSIAHIPNNWTIRWRSVRKFWMKVWTFEVTGAPLWQPTGKRSRAYWPINGVIHICHILRITGRSYQLQTWYHTLAR